MAVCDTQEAGRAPSDGAADEITELLKSLFARTGGCRLVVVSGASGSGRTYAVEKALKAVRPEDAGYAVVRCSRGTSQLRDADSGGRLLCVCDPLELICSSSQDAPMFRMLTNSPRGTARIAVVVCREDSPLPPEVQSELAAAGMQRVSVALPQTATRVALAKHFLLSGGAVSDGPDVDRLAADLAGKTQGCTPADLRRMAPLFAKLGRVVYDARASAPPTSAGGATRFHGYAKLRQELRRCIDMLAGHRQEGGAVVRAARRMATPTGMLLAGVSGTGKTALCDELVRECTGVHFIRVAAPSLFGAWLGETEAKLRAVFSEARASSPAVVIIDDIDAVGRKRGQGSDGDDAGSSAVRALSALLCEIDGIGGNDAIQVLACTSLPWVLDSALLRQGRLEKLLHLAPPSAPDRSEILTALLAAPARLADDVDIQSLADATPGHTASALRFLVRSAGLAALKEEGSISMLHRRHFDAALAELPAAPSPETLQRYAAFVEAQRH